MQNKIMNDLKLGDNDSLS